MIQSDARLARVERALTLAALSMVGPALILGLVVSPPDAVQGQAVRLMYLHVPAVVCAYLAFAVAAFASAGYLIRRKLAWDQLARVAVELGVGFTALTLAEGSLWARPTWGVFWAWDPRLVATVLLLLVYVGYLGVRRLSDDPQLTARRAAVVALIGFLGVPADNLSVLFWRSIHQDPDVRIEDPRMLAALVVALLAFLLLAGCIYLRRLRVLSVAAAKRPTGSSAAAAQPMAPASRRPKEASSPALTAGRR